MARQFFRAGLATSTRNTYNSAQQRFLKFCSATKSHQIPATEATLTLFATHLASINLSYTTIKLYLSAVRHLHVSEGYHEHFNLQLTQRLQLVLWGIRKHQSLTLPKRIRLPITIQIMCSINLLKVTIKQSKTDPFCQGVDIYLGATQKPICPISGILPYLAARGNRAGSLFITEDGRALTRQTFSVMLDSVLEKLHLDTKSFNIHSFLIGAATTAAMAHILESQIMMLGCWQSDAYQRNIKMPPQVLANLSKLLVTQS